MLSTRSEKRPAPGQLIYRGYDICDLVSGVEKDGRYGFEETAYLLLFGNLPDKEHLEDFKKIVTHYRTLPPTLQRTYLCVARHQT